MHRTLISSAVFVAVAFASASATIINIPADYPTIQQDIDSSSDGDTVLVQPGTYVENINFNGHNIVLGSLFLTTGDTTYIAETIIDGGSLRTVVTFESREDSTATIIGFTIQNGHSDYSGGLNCTNNSHPLIIYNMFSENSAMNGRRSGDSLKQQYTTPADVVNAGSDVIIVGGGIYGADNPLTSAQEHRKQTWQAYQNRTNA